MDNEKTPEEAYNEYVDSEFDNIIAFQYWDDEEWTQAMFDLTLERDEEFECDCISCANRRNAQWN